MTREFAGQTLHWARLLTGGTGMYYDAATAAHALGRPWPPTDPHHLGPGAVLFYTEPRPGWATFHGDAGIYVGDGRILRYGTSGPYLTSTDRDPPDSWTPRLQPAEEVFDRCH